MSDSSDYRYLVWGWDEYEEITVDEPEADKIWEEIYKEYCKLTNDNRSLEFYRLQTQLIYLESRRYFANKLFVQILSTKMDNETFNMFMDEIRAWGFRYPKNKKNMADIEDLSRQLKSTGNRINILKSKIESFKAGSGAKMSLTAQCVRLEQALERNNIDPRTTSIEKWVELMNTVREINIERKKKHK